MVKTTSDGRYLMETVLVDGDGEELNITNGNLPVQLQDQFTDIVDLYMHKDLETLTLAQAAVVGSKTLVIESGHSAVAGNTVCLKEGAKFYQGKILVVATNTLTMDSPLDNAFTIAADMKRSEHDLAVDGSVTAVEYHITPPATIDWDITRIIIHIEDSTTMDDGTFGGMPALTNGVVLFVRNSYTKNIFNVKTNGEFAERAYDREYVSKPPAGTGYAMNVRRTFAGQEKNGVVIRLKGSTGDELIVLIQDNLTALDHFHVVVQGHIVIPE